MAVIPYTKQTWNDGSAGLTPLSAARLTVVENGIHEVSFAPTVKALRSTAQSITTATWTLLSWNTETGGWDTAGNAADTQHDTSTNPARLIARYAGKYQVTLYTAWQASTAGIRAAFIQKNSEALPAANNSLIRQGGYNQTAPSTSSDVPITASAVVDMAVNDYVAVVCFQNSGGSLNVETDSYFSMSRLA